MALKDNNNINSENIPIDCNMLIRMRVLMNRTISKWGYLGVAQRRIQDIIYILKYSFELHGKISPKMIEITKYIIKNPFAKVNKVINWTPGVFNPDADTIRWLDCQFNYYIHKMKLETDIAKRVDMLCSIVWGYLSITIWSARVLKIWREGVIRLIEETFK